MTKRASVSLVVAVLAGTGMAQGGRAVGPVAALLAPFLIAFVAAGFRLYVGSPAGVVSGLLCVTCAMLTLAALQAKWQSEHSEFSVVSRMVQDLPNHLFFLLLGYGIVVAVNLIPLKHPKVANDHRY